MGLFGGGYAKPGPGVDKNAPKKKLRKIKKRRPLSDRSADKKFILKCF